MMQRHAAEQVGVRRREETDGCEDRGPDRAGDRQQAPAQADEKR